MLNLTHLTNKTHKTILDIESTADLLGVSEGTIRNWIKCGHLPSSNKNNKYFFYRADIEKVRSKLSNGELEKLNKRANKRKSKGTFIPKEHIDYSFNLNKLKYVIDFIQQNKIKTTVALFLLSLNLLKKENILLNSSIQNILKRKGLLFTNHSIKKEMYSWFSEIKSEDIKQHFSFLLDCDLIDQRDILGIFYQSLLFEGEKSQSGSYYTPSSVVNNIATEYIKKDSKVLDPSCGTGQFLLAFADRVDNPLNIYGIDCDKTAVRIARLNILIKFKNKNFMPNIFCKNTLFDIRDNDMFSFHEDIKDFDFIATNPPWGACFSKVEIKALKRLYPQITSLESFSYFLNKSLELIKYSGTISFILPESILNVRVHKDIREIILKTTQIKKVVCLNRVFKNVFTPVIRLDLTKSNTSVKHITIQNGDKKHTSQQIKWIKNQDFIFNIYSNKLDYKIIDKIYRTKHITLKHKACWALGIVTGDNKKFIYTTHRPGFEPIYRGKDIKRFVLDKPSCYIQFDAKKFQQTAPEEKYRVREKLIYKFISNQLVFAYDNKQRLTLNSANVLIPNIPYYPIKVIAALFNSPVYQFLFKKKFYSIKVLRSHLEVLPLPLWDKEILYKIIDMVNKIIKNQIQFNVLDNYIANKFLLTEREISYINEFIK